MQQTLEVKTQLQNIQFKSGPYFNMSNLFTYQRNKQNFIYRNGCAKEISKKIKDRKNKKWTYKGNNGSERQAGHCRHHREEKAPVVWPHQKDARRETNKMNYGVDTRGKKKKKTSKKNLNGRCTSSHEKKTFRSRSVVKQKGMVYGFRKTATAVTRPER